MDTNVAQAEVKKLRAELARLQRQLQAEKADNTGNLREYSKQRESCGNRDNDETSLPIKQEPRSSQQPAAPRSQAKSNIPPRHPSDERLPGSDFKAGSPEPSFDSEGEDEDEDEPNAPPVQNRKRSRAERMKDELADLNLLSFNLPSGKRRKRRCSTRATTQASGSFTFKAVRSYTADSMVVGPQAQLNESNELTERIRRTTEIWEHNKGLEWRFEFTKARYKPKIPPCVTSKVACRRTKWRRDEVAKYACAYCVQFGRPCFTWVEKQMWNSDATSETEADDSDARELRLLPIHEDDRRRKVSGKNIANIWIDQRTEFRDDDVVKRDEWDEEYSDFSDQVRGSREVAPRCKEGLEAGSYASFMRVCNYEVGLGYLHPALKCE